MSKEYKRFYADIDRVFRSAPVGIRALVNLLFLLISIFCLLEIGERLIDALGTNHF